MDTASTTNPALAADSLTTSLQFLALPVGIYTFTVKEGAPMTTPSDELALPAVQVGVAPAQSEGTVEFVSRAATIDRWLSRRRDMIIAKISGGDARIFMRLRPELIDPRPVDDHPLVLQTLILIQSFQRCLRIAQPIQLAMHFAHRCGPVGRIVHDAIDRSGHSRRPNRFRLRPQQTRVGIIELAPQRPVDEKQIQHLRLY